MRSLAEELAARGHRMVVLAPSRSPELVRESRRLIRAGEFFDPDGGVRVLGVGELLPLAPARRGTAPAPPLDVARTLDDVLEPGAARLRPRARAVRAEHGVGRAAPLARAQRRHVPRAGRAGDLDPGRAPVRRALLRPARRAHGVVRRHARADGARVPGDLPGAAARAPTPAPPRGARRRRPLQIAFVDHEDRQALRLFLRALRRLPDELAWRATVFTPGRRAARARCAAGCASASRSSPPRTASEEAVLAAADVVVAASVGQAPAPGLLVRALGAGAVPVAARLPAYEEILRDGELGLLFEPGDVETLAAQLDPADRRRRSCADGLATAVAGAAPELAWSAVAERFEALYARGRRAPAPAARRRPGARAARRAPADRRRPAHAHRPLVRLRDAGRRAARHRARAGARRDRRHRPQRGLRRARRARQGRGVRRQGDRRRGGHDRATRAR